VGTHVTLSGTFSDVSGVKIGDVEADLVSASATQLEIVVPAGAKTGKITVGNGSTSLTSDQVFTVSLPVIVDLGAFSGDCPSDGYGSTDTVATGINDAGVITGGSCQVVERAGGF
jgi:hypothetical protein